MQNILPPLLGVYQMLIGIDCKLLFHTLIKQIPDIYCATNTPRPALRRGIRRVEHVPVRHLPLPLLFKSLS